VSGGTVSPEFLAQFAALTAPPGTGMPAMPMPPPPPPPAHQSGPSIAWLNTLNGLHDATQAPPAPPAPPAPEPGWKGTLSQFQGATAAVPPPETVTPVDPSLMPPKGIDLNAVPTPAPPQPQAPVPDVQFRGLGGGSIPAHEAAARGPTQDAHLMASFDPPMQAAGNIDLRSNMQAAAEEAAYENQARSAMARQEAAEKVQLQRQAELEARQVDYENQVTQLGQAKIDDDRWWKKKGTGDKIGAILLSFIGGLTVMDPRGNGRNLAYEALMKEADNDVEAQKFDYMVQQDKAKNAHNAYALALEKFGSEDAAAGVARAANIDYSLAKLGQMQAQWKGTDASNYADDVRARLLAERERTIAAGIKFIPAQSAPGRYQMMIRGQMAPGTFSEKDAQAAFMEHQVKPAEKYDEQTLGIGGQMAVKAMEGAGKDGVEGAKDIAHQMQTAGIPKMRALTQAALAAMADDEGGKGEAATRVLVGTLVPFVGESAANGIMSDKANAREQALQAFANLNMNQLSGGAISPSEEGRLKKQLGSASDPAARRRALTSVMTQLDAAEKNIKAPYVGTGAAERYDRGAGAKPTGSAKSLTFHGK